LDLPIIVTDATRQHGEMASFVLSVADTSTQ